MSSFQYFVYLGAVRFEIERPLTKWERLRCWFSPWRYEVRWNGKVIKPF
jgi:hypothetical protein